MKKTLKVGNIEFRYNPKRHKITCHGSDGKLNRKIQLNSPSDVLFFISRNSVLRNKMVMIYPLRNTEIVINDNLVTLMQPTPKGRMKEIPLCRLEHFQDFLWQLGIWCLDLRPIVKKWSRRKPVTRR